MRNSGRQRLPKPPPDPVHHRRVRSITRKLLRHYRQTARDLPWRRTTDPYAIWVSEIMLQQTQIATVLPFYHRWMTELPNLDAAATAPLERVLQLWSGLGYYARPRRFQEAARHIRQHLNGHWPTDVEAWTRLPGIGRYTAGAICSIAFNQPSPVVDGNVKRVLSRLWALTPTAEHQRLWQLAEDHVRAAAALPARGRRNCADLNQALMELGALICTPSRPRCTACPLSQDCLAFEQGDPERYPQRRPTQAPIRKHLRVWVLHWRQRFFLQQHDQDTWNQGLWHFPTEDLDCARASQNAPPTSAPPSPQPLFSLTHAITNHRFKVQVVLLQGSPAHRHAPSTGRWYTLTRLAQLPLSGLHRKIRQRLSDTLGRP